MGERREGQDGNPLVSGRGVTSVKDVVVQRIAGLAAQEVEGVHMGGGAARTASWLSGGRAGAQEHTRGVSVDVGRTEVAIDLTMAIDYGNDILQTVNRVRERISARVQPLTGLAITELNVTVSDIVFPEEDDSSDEDEDRTESLSAGQQPTQSLQPAVQDAGDGDEETTVREPETVEISKSDAAESETAESETEEPEAAARVAEEQETAEREAEPEPTHRGPLAEEEDVDRTSEIDLQKKDDEEKSR